jgi:hypothetical protein
VRAHPGPTGGGQGDYGVIRKLHPSRAATRSVLLGGLHSYEHRGSARQTGLRPCDGKQHELTIFWEKTRREVEVWAHPGPTGWGQGHYGVIRKLHPRRASTRSVLLGGPHSYEHRGSARQTGLRPCEGLGSFSERVERHARYGSLPQNRASPVRGFAQAFSGRQKVYERRGSTRKQGFAPCVRSWSLSGRL